jgi:hypothetical protein
MWACELRPVASRQRLLSCLRLLNDHCTYIELCGEALGVEHLYRSIDLLVYFSAFSLLVEELSSSTATPHISSSYTCTYRPQPRTRPSRLPYVPGAASSGTPCVVQDRRLKFEGPDPKRRSSASVSLARALALSLPPFPTCSPHVPYTGISAVTVTAVLS